MQRIKVYDVCVIVWVVSSILKACVAQRSSRRISGTAGPFKLTALYLFEMPEATLLTQCHPRRQSSSATLLWNPQVLLTRCRVLWRNLMNFMFRHNNTCMFSFGYFPGVRLSFADVLEPSVGPSSKPLRMDLTEGNETPGKYPKENIQVLEHGENLKSRTKYLLKLSSSCPCTGFYIIMLLTLILSHGSVCTVRAGLCPWDNRGKANGWPPRRYIKICRLKPIQPNLKK
jgi:hypothetical protein